MAAKTSTTTGDPEAGRIVSIKDLAEKVERILGQLGHGAGGAPATAPAPPAAAGSVDDQVSRAVAAAREQDRARSEADQQRQATEDRLKALEERTERRPSDLKRLTKWLWGAGGDD